VNFKSFIAAMGICAVASPAFAQQGSGQPVQPAATTVAPGKHIDSLWNGALIGAGVGAVGAWVFTRANCGPRGYDEECTAIAGPLGTILFVPAGAVGGAIIDRLINKTLPAGATSRTAIAPLLSNKNGKKDLGVALRMKIRF
jgi:hypothetical protein